MPIIKEDLIKKLLSEKFPGIEFKYQFYALKGFKHNAIGVTEDKLYLLKLSFFRMKPKDATEIPFSQINDITFERGDIKGMDIIMEIKTANEKFLLRSNKMIGYNPTEQAEKAYKFIFDKISK